MKEKKVNRVLLYLLGFLCGHSAVVGMHPFMVPMLAAVYSIRQSTFGLFAAMLFGGAVMYGIGGWNAGSFFQMGPYVMGEQQLPVTYFLLKYSLILIGVLVGLNLTEGVRRNLSEHTDRSGKKTKRKGVKQRLFKRTPIHDHFRTSMSLIEPGCTVKFTKPDQLFHESKITVRFWIVTIVLAAITIITLKIR